MLRIGQKRVSSDGGLSPTVFDALSDDIAGRATVVKEFCTGRKLSSKVTAVVIKCYSVHKYLEYKASKIIFIFCFLGFSTVQTDKIGFRCYQ